MKKIGFVFLSMSVILLAFYSYRLMDDISKKNVYNEVDTEDVISENEGESSVDNSYYILEDLDLIFEELYKNKEQNLILANKGNLLDENYEPIPIRDAAGDIPSTKEQMLLQEEAYKAVIDLFEGASSAGIDKLWAVSGYRTYSYQNQLFNNKVNSFSGQYDLETAKEMASEIVAIPGTSEHQTGLAIDFSSSELLQTSDPLVEDFKYTPEGEWLYNNAWKHGFILRYLPEKKDITGIISEPWHFRYVGKPHAEYMTVNKLCLEEYITYIKENKEIDFKDHNGANYKIGYVQKENHDILLSDVFSMEKVINVSEIGEDEYIITLKL